MDSLPTAGAPKVAIPRVSHPASRGLSGEKHEQRAPRARRACLNCRKRKIKCSGDTPRCASCIANDLDCVYDQARRDRLKSATSKNKDLVLLLKELSLRPSLDDSDRARIQDALEEFEDDSMSMVSGKSGKRRKLSVPEEQEKDDDRHPPTATHARDLIGSEEALALLDEDLLRNRKSRSTGYVGQGSGVQWLRILQDELKPEGPDQHAVSDKSNLVQQPSAHKAISSASVTDASFYLDANSAELDVDVDPYELPPKEAASKLFECYKQTVHKSFPFLPPQFEDQFRRYFEAVKSERPFTVPDRWLAILNVVFAIGARYSHLINAEWQGEERDHLIYMTRSVRLLGSWPFAAAPDLALIQVSGLLAFYYQVIGHVSRGWIMIGISIRLALALGLHLRNEDPNIPFSKKETILRTWWALHAIECQLSAITGRPCVLSHEDCTVALPQTLSEDLPSPISPINPTQPSWKKESSQTPASGSMSEESRILQSPRSYLDAHLKIGLIMQKLLSELYSPRTAQFTWKRVQENIPRLLQELDDWKQGALPDKDILRVRLSPQPEGPREDLLLRFYYFSTRILITRPCLCRSGRKTKDQSDPSALFDQRTAETCVAAALGLAELLPSSDPQSLYRDGPWWSIVHMIMQAMAVLLLELSYGLNHMQGDRSDVKKSVKKMLHWLGAMRHTDTIVERAHKVVIRILQQHKFQTVFNEILTDTNPAHEQTHHASFNSGHAHPDPTMYPPMGSMIQMLPTEWYSGPFAANTQPEDVVFSPVTTNLQMTDPQLLVGFGQTQEQPQLLSQMTQMPSQAEQYRYLEYPYNNQFMFSNPFMTSYDQDAPFSLNPDDLWPRAGALGDGSLGEQNGINYPSYMYEMDQNASSGSQ
ncbi:hypothetical protein DPSP01_011545 [Paraphaeosphaeria sporulosa]|uniref:Zn(2)-C6 fungal-type domain-containing protein n=1 Tax=Paraphaeosphaeria sporulosa TaxID=1460663 RepID=A0A177C403_9PLEO|nr:uncharacterized protein CC84DRAFT_1022855 [Paraphaeosphaeria sporulosa]OAG02474.1 hypothetical protein CC84DRAFT_1022855 [Paraphaeosphaeria sporulosa]